MDDLVDKVPSRMSGGERRRAEVALAVARRPSCLVADEPYIGVTPREQEVLSSVFRGLAREGIGLLLTGHDLEPLFEVADDVVWMTGGTTHHLGSPEEARTHHGFRKDYLGPKRMG